MSSSILLAITILSLYFNNLVITQRKYYTLYGNYNQEFFIFFPILICKI